MITFLLLLVLLFLCIREGNYKDLNSYNQRYFSYTNKIFFLLIVLFISIFRYNVGYDYHTYYNYLITENSWGLRYFEPLPRLILQIAVKLKSPVLFFVIINSIILLLIYNLIKTESNNFYQSFLIFFALFYLDTLSIMRQWLGVAFVVYGYKYIKQKKFIHYLICVLLATLSHSSAILCIFIYFVYNYIDLSVNIVVMLLGLFLGTKIINLIFDMIPFLSSYKYYLNGFVAKGSSKAVYMWYLLYAISLVTYLKTGFSLEAKRLLSIVGYGISFPKLLGPAIGLRMSLYFNVFYILLFPYVLKKYTPRKYQDLLLLPFYMYFILFLIIDSRNNQGYTKYILYFFKEF